MQKFILKIHTINWENVYPFVYAVCFGPKFPMDLKFACNNLKFDDFHSQSKASPTHDTSFRPGSWQTALR